MNKIYQKSISLIKNNSFVSSSINNISSFLYTVKNRKDIFSLDIADFIHLQQKNGIFIRPDMIIRYLFIEQHYNKNIGPVDAVALYKKMQDFRQHSSNGDKMTEKFYSLISSYEKYGYKPSSAVEVDRNLFIRDGSHRTALALYLEIPEITVHYTDMDMPVERKLEMYEKNGFSDMEKQAVADKISHLLDKFNHPLYIVILGSDTSAVNNISDEISKYGTITDINSVLLSSKEHSSLINQLSDRKSVRKNTSVIYENTVHIINLKISQPEYDTPYSHIYPAIKQAKSIKIYLQEQFAQNKEIVALVPQNFKENRLFEKVLDNYNTTYTNV